MRAMRDFIPPGARSPANESAGGTHSHYIVGQAEQQKSMLDITHIIREMHENNTVYTSNKQNKKGNFICKISHYDLISLCYLFL